MFPAVRVRAALVALALYSAVAAAGRAREAIGHTSVSRRDVERANAGTAGIVFDDDADEAQMQAAGLNDDPVHEGDRVEDGAFGGAGDELWRAPAPRAQDEVGRSAGKPAIFAGDLNQLYPGNPHLTMIRAPVSVGPELGLGGRGGIAGATSESDAHDRAPAGNNHFLEVVQTGAAKGMAEGNSDAKKKIVEEFDDQAAEGDETPEDLHNDEGDVRQGEAVTLDDQRRLMKGDVDHVRPQAHHHAPVSPRLAQRRLLFAAGSRRVQPATPTTALVSQKQQVTTEAKVAASPQERMKSQCLAYAGYLSGQDIQGPELIRVWKGTCDPAVRSGDADQAYTVMCNVLGSAIEDFAVHPTWSGDKVCDAVLRVFNEAQIGV